MIDTYTADAIRYWAANARLGTDTYFDIQEMLDTSKRIMTKLWNSSKFVLSHLKDFNPNYQLSYMLPIDRWIIERTNETILDTSKYLLEYEVGLARKIVDDLFWKDFCDYYIEIVKERLYQPDIHGIEERKSAQYAIYYCLLNILKMYAIYIPHETEYIYLKGFKDFVGSVSIHLTEWEKPLSVDISIIDFGEIVKNAIAEVRKYKSENNLSMRAEIDEAAISCTKKHREWLLKTEKDFMACTRSQKINYKFNQ